MNIKVVLITLLVILGCLVSNSAMDMSGHHNRTLNKHLRLITNPNKDTKVYLDATKEELERVKRNPTADSAGYVKFLEDFIKLETVLDHPECTYEEYEIMERVTSQVKGHRHVSRPLMQKPVRKVIYDVGMSRAEKCRPEWPKKFEEVYSAMSSTVKELAEFSNWDWLKQEYDNTREFMKRLIDYRYEGLDERIIRDAYDHIALRSPDPAVPYRQVIVKYLKQPCIEYRSSLAYKVFLQARYDAQMFRKHRGFLLPRSEHDTSLMPFYLAMAHNELCRAVEDENFINRVWAHWWRTEIVENGQED